MEGDERLVSKLKCGYRMDKPLYATNEMPSDDEGRLKKQEDKAKEEFATEICRYNNGQVEGLHREKMKQK
jgi:hypothetical protein